MNILSINDNVGGVRYILDKLKVPITNYFRYESDNDANLVYDYNFVNDYANYDTVLISRLEKINKHNIPNIDLFIANLHCRYIDKLDPHIPRLFFELNPKHYIITNSYLNHKEFDNLFGSSFTLDSSLVSSQYRVRPYWTNFDVTEPNDRNLYIKDITHGSDDDEIGFITNNGNAYVPGGNATQTIVHTAENKARPITPSCRSTSQLKLRTSWDTWRYLSCIELERLQGLSDNFTLIPDLLTNKSTRIKLIGNEWQCDTLLYLLQSVLQYT